MAQPDEKIAEEAKRMLRRCETCIYLIEVAGGPDHGDYRCTNKESHLYDRRVPENLCFGFKYGYDYDYELKDAIEEIKKLKSCKSRVPREVER